MITIELKDGTIFENAANNSTINEMIIFFPALADFVSAYEKMTENNLSEVKIGGTAYANRMLIGASIFNGDNIEGHFRTVPTAAQQEIDALNAEIQRLRDELEEERRKDKKIAEFGSMELGVNSRQDFNVSTSIQLNADSVIRTTMTGGVLDGSELGTLTVDQAVNYIDFENEYYVTVFELGVGYLQVEFLPADGNVNLIRLMLTDEGDPTQISNLTFEKLTLEVV